MQPEKQSTVVKQLAVLMCFFIVSSVILNKKLLFFLQQVIVSSLIVEDTDWPATLQMIFFYFKDWVINLSSYFFGIVLMAFQMCSSPHITGYRCQEHEWAVGACPASQVPNTSVGGEKWRTKAGIEIGPGGSNQQLQSACQSQRKGMSRSCYIKINENYAAD